MHVHKGKGMYVDGLHNNGMKYTKLVHDKTYKQLIICGSGKQDWAKNSALRDTKENGSTRKYCPTEAKGQQSES